MPGESLPTQDFEVGAFEVKNATTDDRAKVTNADPVAADFGLVVRNAPQETHLGEVGGKVFTVAAAELTRPADTNAYAALDAISDSTSAATVVMQPAVARVAAGSGYIVGARLHTDRKGATERIRAHIFHTAPAAINDNSPYTTLYANKAKKVGYIDFPAFTTEDPTNSTQATSQNFDIRIPFKCDAADSKLYVVLETLDAIAAPASAQKYYLELDVDQN